MKMGKSRNAWISSAVGGEIADSVDRFCGIERLIYNNAELHI